MGYYSATVKDMLGLTMASVKNDGDELIFTSTCGRKFRQYHEQDCCETVRIEDIEGDLQDLVGSPLTVSEECCDKETEVMKLLGLIKETVDDSGDSETWTFYRFATAKGWVVVRWYGTSNGYYSESVDFEETTVRS